MRSVLLAVVVMAGSFSFCSAQKLLNKPVSIVANGQTVSEVLKTISDQGGFYFSYNSSVVPGDSIVTIRSQNQPLKSVLDKLLAGNYRYKETGNYIILQKATVEMVSYISGTVTDEETLKPVDFASVYSKTILASTLSDDDGSFRLKLRDHAVPFTLSISKIGYADTSIVVQSEIDSKFYIRLRPRAIDLDEVQVFNSGGDRTWLARVFVSSRLRTQSRNLSQFFVSLPYQVSLTPGLGTHGKMSGQIANNFSLNLLGGYTAGVNGLELAGGFNISKKDVKYVQTAGIFNLVFGNLLGVQLAGLHNDVGDCLRGVQISGFSGLVRKNMQGVQVSGFLSKNATVFHGVQVSGAINLSGKNSIGVQVAGLANYISAAFVGVQVAGALNRVGHDSRGVQLAGLANISTGKMNGFQLSPVNYSKHLKGAQLGLINIADSSSGYSIGLINITKNGISNISLYANELTPLNLAWKMGNRKFYSILFAGSRVTSMGKVYAFGLGAGREFCVNKVLSIAFEIISQNLYLGSWENMPSVVRLQPGVIFKLTNRIHVAAGPALNIFGSQSEERLSAYKIFPRNDYPDFRMGHQAASWLGWQGGISWRYGR